MHYFKFGEAIENLKNGKAMSRQGWNGKNAYIYYIPTNNYNAETEVAKAEFGDKVPYCAYIAMKTTQGNVVPWVASQTDILAEDWFIVDKK